MINAFIALSLLQQPLGLDSQADGAVKIFEHPMPSGGRIAIQAVVKLPPLSPREWGAMLLIRDALSDGTQSYTGANLLNHTTFAGDPIRFSLSSDHFRIGYAMPAANLSLGSDMLEELLNSAYLKEDKLKSIAENIAFRRVTPWERMLSPWQPDYGDIRRDEVLRVYRRVFRPENTTVAVGGDIQKGQGEKEFRDRFQDWKPEDPGRRRIPEGKPSPSPAFRGTAITSLSAEIVRSPAELLLAAYALGVGKGGAAFRVVREGLSLSYRQEALLLPGDKSLRLALIFQHSGEPDVAKVKSALKDDINGWTEATLERAKGMMAASFDLRAGGLPIYLNPRGPLSLSLEDRTYWLAYTGMKLGSPNEIDATRRLADSVDLKSLKELCLEWLSSSSESRLPSR